MDFYYSCKAFFNFYLTTVHLLFIRVVGKKKEKGEGMYNRNTGKRKMGNEDILRVVKKKKRILEEIIKNKYLNEIELRIEN